MVKKYQKKILKDPCTHTYTRGVNGRTCVLSRRSARSHIYALCACVCAQIFTIFFGISLLSYELNYLNYLMNLSFKFHNDPSFRCGDICKPILLKIINFQCILHISTVLHLQSLQRWIISEWLWDLWKLDMKMVLSKENENAISSTYFVF